MYRGQLKYLDKVDVLEVAVKTLKVGSQQEDRIKFLQEAAVMGQFSHPYVIKIYGVVTCIKQVSITKKVTVARIHSKRAVSYYTYI